MIVEGRWGKWEVPRVTCQVSGGGIVAGGKWRDGNYRSGYRPIPGVLFTHYGQVDRIQLEQGDDIVERSANHELPVGTIVLEDHG